MLRGQRSLRGHFRSKTDKIFKNLYLTPNSMDLIQTWSEQHLSLPNRLHDRLPDRLPDKLHDRLPDPQRALAMKAMALAMAKAMAPS